MIMTDIKRKIDEKEIVSFDIFDTLLIRPFLLPNDLFSYINEKYCVGSLDFRTYREHAFDRAVRAYVCDGVEEVTFDQIYEFIGNELFKSFHVKELAFEKAFLRSNPVLAEIYQYAVCKGKKIVITSDMYLPQEFIEELLKINGYDKYYALYLSSSCKRLKYSKNLFKKILYELDIKPNQVVHIGDNKESDYSVPKLIGLDAIYIQNYADKFRQRYQKLFDFYMQDAHDLTRSIIFGLFAKRVDCLGYWERIGYLFCGPLAMSYMQWLLAEAQKLNIKKLLFVMRDGHCLKRCFDKINNSSISAVEVYAPRMVALASTLDLKIKSGQKKEIVDGYRAIINYYSQKLNISRDLQDKLENDDFVVEYYKNNECRISDLAKNKLDEYRRYIADKVDGYEKIGVVDFATVYFTAQRFLERVFEKSGSSITGFYFFVGKWFGLDLSDIHFRQQQYEFFHMEFQEFLISSPEPPVVSIDAEGNVVYKAVDQYEQTRIANYSKVLKGADMFYEDYLKYFSNDETCVISPSTVIALMNHFIKNPTAEDIDMWKDMYHSWRPDHSSYVRIFKEWYAK